VAQHLGHPVPKLHLGQLQGRLARLTDAYIDRVIEREVFEERKAALLMERKGVGEHLANLEDQRQSIPDRLAEFLELAGAAYLAYEMGLSEEKRDLLTTVISNRQLGGKA